MLEKKKQLEKEGRKKCHRLKQRMKSHSMTTFPPTLHRLMYKKCYILRVVVIVNIAFYRCFTSKTYNRKTLLYAHFPYKYKTGLQTAT